MSRRNTVLNIIFLIIVVLELVGKLLDNITFEYTAKPLIMIWIAVYFLLNTKKKSLMWLVLLAFFFSWLGDMFLMFSGGYENEMLFYAGVGGFFFAQLIYISVFLFNSENSIKGFLLRNPLWFIPLVGYGVLIYYLLYPGLEGIMVPIILVYALSLIAMSLAALNRRDRVGIRSYQLVFIGSLFFVASDSMIAIDKFHSAIPYSGIWIMLTYILAQYLIVRGLLLEKEKANIR
jgi:uncharacterized membrane protein YhhN